MHFKILADLCLEYYFPKLQFLVMSNVVIFSDTVLWLFIKRNLDCNLKQKHVGQRTFQWKRKEISRPKVRKALSKTTRILQNVLESEENNFNFSLISIIQAAKTILKICSEFLYWSIRELLLLSFQWSTPNI